MSELLTVTAEGLYCVPGRFHIDPWRPVERAVITHAHGDHATPGCGAYLAAAAGHALLALRVEPGARIETAPYGEARRMGDVQVSLHPAGHVLGSAQVRIAQRDRVWVVSGDYKLAADPTCDPFEPQRCDVFVTESTFGLPVFRWTPAPEVIASIGAWWEDNRAQGVTSVLFVYALGKAQRVLAGLAQHYAGALPGPVFCHGSVERLNEGYRASGVALPMTTRVTAAPAGMRWHEALVLAPPSARGSRWMHRFLPASTGFASGWMALHRMYRRSRHDRGFALSDHADWPALESAIAASDAEEVWVTHGYRDEIVRSLREQGRSARALATRFTGEEGAEVGEPA